MRKYVRPGFAVPLGVALAIAVVSIIFFGLAGFWLGLALLLFVRVALWGIPLIKLSYEQAPAPAEAPGPEASPSLEVPPSAASESVDASR